MAKKRKPRRGEKGYKERYYGIVKVKQGQKFCWISKEDKNGWSLGFALNNRTVWLKGLRFRTKEEVDRAFSKHSKIIFVLLRNSKFIGKY